MNNVKHKHVSVRFNGGPVSHTTLADQIIFCSLDALYDELSRSSVIARTAVDDFKQAYVTITSEFQEQRQHLLEHLHHIQQDIKQ